MSAKRFDLTGRCALVTGASRGIGRALAAGMAQAGADLVLSARDAAALEETAAAARAAGRRVEAIAADVSALGSLEALFGEIAQRGLSPDILIANAGVEQVRASAEVDEALWDRILDTNLKGAFFTAQRFARPLLAAGRPGAILLLGSLTSAVGVPTAAPYGASKSGVLGLARALSTEWAPKGLRVNALGPGYFRTAMTEPFYADDAWSAAMLAKIPQNRFGALEDLVGPAVFLVSDAARYVTGQILYVDGGYLASI